MAGESKSAYDAGGRVLHPVYKVVEAAESMWSRDRAQQWQRTQTVVRAIAEAGMLMNGELIDGKFYCKDATEGTRTGN